MFSRLVTLVPIAALVAVAAAAPNALEARDGSSQCDASGQYCCNSAQGITNGSIFNGSLGSVLTGTGVNAGLTCDPITVLGLSNACQDNQQPTCCTNNDFNGVVNVACSPINIDL